jgi:Bacterial Ig domain
MSFRRRALFLAGLFVAVSCSDAGNPIAPPEEPGPQPVPGAGTALDCRLHVPTGTLSCQSPQPGTGGALGDITVGGQDVKVRLQASNHVFRGDSLDAQPDTMEIDVTVQNLMRQALGTEDGTTLDPEGVRLFFSVGPVGQPTGAVTVANASTGMFMTGEEYYFQYDTILRPGVVSPPQRWVFAHASTVENIRFQILVQGAVPYPNGFVEVSAAADTLSVDETVDLDGVAYSAESDTLSLEPVWTSSDPAVASVDATGVVTGAATGTAIITASYGGTAPDSVVVVVNDAPVVGPDTTGAAENLTVVRPAGTLLARASDAEALSVVADSVASAEGGVVILQADGGFRYHAPAGFSGEDSFPFQVTDGVRTTVGTMVVDVAPTRYWFVRAGAEGDGRDHRPFGSVAEAQGRAVENDTIVVLESATALDEGVTLQNRQALIGAGISRSIYFHLAADDSLPVLVAGMMPGLTRTAAGSAVTLGQDNLVAGLGISAAAGAALEGTGFGTLRTRDLTVNPAGPALLLADGVLDAEFITLSSTGSGTTGLSLAAVSGSLSAPLGTIAPAAGATGEAVRIDGSSARIALGVDVAGARGIDISGVTADSVTLSGTLGLTARGIRVHDNTGGVISFTGGDKSVSTTGTNDGVSLAANTGATVRFGGGGLNVDTDDGMGFRATGGGTVIVQGPDNTIASTGGRALYLDGVGTGAAGTGLTFASVSASGGDHGVRAVGLTGEGGFQVQGGTLDGTTDNGIHLENLGALPVELEAVSVTGALGAGKVGIFASDVDALTVAGTTVNVSNGPALSLSGGVANGTFATLSSANSAGTGVVLSGMGGTLTAAAGSITGPASTAFAVTGGGISVAYAGDVSQATAGFPLVAVNGGHTGTLAFSGGLSASNGVGLQFNDADGSYQFTGTATLNGGDAGVDIVGGSAGTFAFGTGVAVTSPSGTAFLVNGSTPAVTYAGSLTQANGALLVDVTDQAAGSVVFQTGTLQASAGAGIRLSNADGTVSFDGTTALSGGAPGISVMAGSTGTIGFGSGTSVTNPAADGLYVNASAPTLTYAGSINVASGSGRPVQVRAVTGGTITVSGSVSSGAAGIVLQENTGGSTVFSGSKTLSTGANAAVTLLTNTGHTAAFTNGGLNVTTTSGAGISASGGGTLTVTGAGNQLSTGTGAALSLANVAVGGDGLAFASVSANGAANGVSLTNVSGPGAITVAGGTITGAAGGAAFLVSGGGVSASWGGSVTQAQNAPLLSVAGGHTGTLTFSTGTLTGDAGTGLQFTDADGSYFFTGTTDLSGGDAGIDIAAASSGTVNVTPAGGQSASIVSPTGAAIAVAGGSGDLVYNGSVTQATASQPLLSVAGGHSGDLAFGTGTLTATGGTGLQFDNADGTYAFNGTLNLANGVGGADAGIDVQNGSGGTFTFNASSAVTNPANQAIVVQGSAPVFTYSGSITKNNGSATAILVQNNTGGTITFNGDRSTETKTLSTGTAAAVNLSGNTGASIVFSGGGLNITTGTGNGFSATGGGTVQVTGAANTVSSAGGIAVNVQNTSIGASGLSWQSVSANGGANGIVLSGTGTASGMQVTGTGTAGSGGTIQNTTGSDGGVSGNGVYLNGARGVSLSWMNFSSTANNGVYGTGVRGFTADKLRFTSAIGNSNNAGGSHNESAIQLVDVGGAVRLTNSRFDGAAYNAVRIENISGTSPVLDSLVIAGDTVASMQGSTADVRGTAMLVNLMDGSADVRVRDNRVLAWWGNGIHVLSQGTASATARITSNFVDNTNGALAGAGGIAVGGCRLGFSITGNSVRHTNGTAISADMNPGCTQALQGTIDGNAVGVSGDANSGSGTGIGIFASGRAGTTTIRISNNTLRQINGSASGAITTVTGDNTAFGGSGTMNATITGNDIRESGTTVNNAQHGILITHGATSGPPADAHQGCYDIQGNTITSFTSGTANNRIRVNQRFSTTSRFPGYTGASTSGPDLATYLLGRNTASTSTNANSSTGGFLNTSPAGSACPQPTL